MQPDTASERAKYETIWTLDAYRVRSPGLRHLGSALEWLKPPPGSSVTDWGAGSGQAAEALHAKGYQVRLVDIAKNAYRGTLPFVESCLWELPHDLGIDDYGFCADVMEHIPPDKVQMVFDQIASRTRVAAYFQIALFDDTTYINAGPLHLSVFPPEWWQERVSLSFKSVEARMIKQKHLMIVAKP